MYLCPCSCSKADCENEEDVLICLPRNLSYAGESYLDRYSVSSAFVHNPKLEKQLLQADVQDGYLKAGAAARAELRKELGKGEEEGEEGEEDEEGGGRRRGEGESSGSGSDSELLLGAGAMARPHLTYYCYTPDENAAFRPTGGPDSCDVGLLEGDATTTTTTTMSLPFPTTDDDDTTTPPSSSPLHPPPPQLTVTIACDKSSSSPSSAMDGQGPEFDGYVVNTAVTESPDSDLVSEEGIFVNMMDDLDGLGSGPGGKSTLSEASDDTYVSGDSMYYSPVDVEEMDDDDEGGRVMRGDDLRVSLEEAVQQAAFTFHPPQESSPPNHHDEVCPGVEDNNGLVLSLPLPHANEGESESDGDCTAHNTDRDSNDGEVEIVKPAGGAEDSASSNSPESRSASAITVTTDNDTGGKATTPTTSKQPTPAVSKNTSGLEIHLTDMSAAMPDTGDRGPLSSSYHDLLSPNSPLYEDREFNFHRTELRKSTSLKSTKTPPGTPRRKKVVRFADAMGLDLESVRHVLNLESPPKIPPSAMKDLQPGLSEDRKAMGSKFITETFAQPGADPRFRERVMADKVVLENALIVSGSITGVVRVANIAFHKAVRVRFTTNGWASFHDIAASYMANSNDGPTDRFSFTLVPPPEFCPGSRLEFAISYSANGADYWDNNRGTNYVFECYAKTVPTEAENAWMHFL